MYFLAYVAEASGEHQLHLRVYILDVVLDYKLALFYAAVYVAQRIEKRVQLVGGK